MSLPYNVNNQNWVPASVNGPFPSLYALALPASARELQGVTCAGNPRDQTGCPRSTLLLRMIEVVVFSTPSTLPIWSSNWSSCSGVSLRNQAT